MRVYFSSRTRITFKRRDNEGRKKNKEEKGRKR
jgi:hypothetical protein